MKTKILNFLSRTQKATAALLTAASAVASAEFIPAPWNRYAAIAVVLLAWVVTYAVPFVVQAVDAFPDDQLDADDVADVADDAPVTGEVIEPPTEEIPEVSDPTVGIPVIEVADSGIRSEPGPTVDEIMNRLRAEGSPSVA